MEFQKASTEQVLNLKGIPQGRDTTIVITEASQNCELWFQHAGDTWRKDPRFTGVPTGGVIIQTLSAPSAVLQLRFVAAPTKTYYVSAIPNTQLED